MNTIGKLFIVIGIAVILLGCFILLAQRIKFPLGRLPGDFFIAKKHFVLYFPFTTSLVVSIILTIIFYFLSRK